MPGWTPVDTHPTQGRTFQRPLDLSELSFALDGRFHGTADSMQHFQVRLIHGSRDANIFSDANVVRAWVSTKRRYPLAGATVQGPGTSQPLTDRVPNDSKTDGGGDSNACFPSKHHFVVRERDLGAIRPNEIVIGQVADAEEAQRRALAILNGPRPLSDEQLAKLYVFREADAERMNVLHMIMLIAHCVSDQTAARIFVGRLLDTLARGGGPDSEPAQMQLEDRLAMTVPWWDVEPVYLHSLSPARRRWRRAAGFVIHQLRVAKMQGGHTLPCCLTHSTPHVAARSCHIFTSLTATQSATMFANCRLHNITFGNAYFVLAQVAMTRVLYRRYLRGEISEEEWAYRKRQPHIIGGVLNLRPYLDRAWFGSGGGGEFALSIGFFVVQLPCMALGMATKQHEDGEHEQERVSSDGAPPFSDLLTFERFLHRAGLAKKQISAFVSHPLFFDFVACQCHVKQLKLECAETVDGDDVRRNLHSDEVLAATDISAIRTYGVSNLGNVDLISPSEYPLPPSHPLSPYSSVSHPAKAGYVIPPSPSSTPSDVDMTPKIEVEYARSYLHTRPAELYLNASTWRGQLNMDVYYDGNVFEDAVVKEWLDEVKGEPLQVVPGVLAPP